MKRDPIRGNTIRMTFDDGLMAGKSVDHIFDDYGNVSWRMAGGDPEKQPTKAKKCAITPVDDDVWAVAYLAESGYTLTMLLNFKTRRLVAFSSNEKDLGVQQGSFESNAMGEIGPVSTRSRSRYNEAPSSVH
jgi:hypothetical protein